MNHTASELIPEWRCEEPLLFGVCGLPLGETAPLPQFAREVTPVIPVGCPNGHRFLLRVASTGDVVTERGNGSVQVQAAWGINLSGRVDVRA